MLIAGLLLAAQITSFRVEPTLSSDDDATLRWTVTTVPQVGHGVPGGVGTLTHFRIYWIAGAMNPGTVGTASWFDYVPPTMPPGNFEILLGGLNPQTTYGFGASGFNGLDEVCPLVTTSFVTPNDLVAPAPVVVTFDASGTSESSLRFTWLASGDDGTSGGPAHHVDICWSSQQDITQALFDSPSFGDGRLTLASGTPGGAMACTLLNLNPGTDYWVALVNRDNAGNSSSISTAGASMKTFPASPPGAQSKKKGSCSTSGAMPSFLGLLAAAALAAARRR